MFLSLDSPCDGLFQHSRRGRSDREALSPAAGLLDGHPVRTLSGAHAARRLGLHGHVLPLHRERRAPDSLRHAAIHRRQDDMGKPPLRGERLLQSLPHPDAALPRRGYEHRRARHRGVVLLRRDEPLCRHRAAARRHRRGLVPVHTSWQDRRGLCGPPLPLQRRAPRRRHPRPAGH